MRKEAAKLAEGNYDLHFRSDSYSEINDLAVDPAYQRKGIAGKLLKRCLADMRISSRT